MSRYVTIDGGTTNTRIFLAENNRITDGIKINLGAEAGIENNTLLQANIKAAVQSLLERNGLIETDIVCILASGMITSEFGLCCLEHLRIPIGIDGLHDGMFKTSLPKISGIPLVFIRGVKKSCEDVEDADVMRGEETELMGILNPDDKNCIYVLPGSHGKIIQTDENGRICDFFTTMTGEMLSSLSQQTILKDAVDLRISKTESEYLLRGYDYCRQSGINRALFKIRLLKTLFHCDPIKIYSYFLGVVLCGEIEQILSCNAETLVIGGKAQIKTAMAEILKNRDRKKIVVLDAQTVEHSVALGAIKIFEHSAN